MLPLVCNDAVAILFMFDLSRKSTLNSIKEWYRQARGFNKVGLGGLSCAIETERLLDAQTAIPLLVGTKYDAFSTFSQDEQAEITTQVGLRRNKGIVLDRTHPAFRIVQARRFSRAMKAPLIFCSTSHSINVQKIFKIVLSKGNAVFCAPVTPLC